MIRTRPDLAHLIHGGGIQVDGLTGLSHCDGTGCGGAICAWTWHAALIGWRRFADGQDVDFLEILPAGSDSLGTVGTDETQASDGLDAVVNSPMRLISWWRREGGIEVF